MTEQMPILLVPGATCSARLYAEQIPALWRFGPVMIADHTRDDTMAGIARRILAAAPPRFVLIGLSMGGYIAFEMMRQAAARVSKLALLDTSARADTPEQIERRETHLRLAEGGKFSQVQAMQFPRMFHASRHGDEALRRVFIEMAQDVGVEAFVRQQKAIMGRPNSVPGLAAIRCPTLVLVGDSDEITPPDCSVEIAEGIEGARLVTLKACGHLSTLEQPAAVNRCLAALLQA